MPKDDNINSKVLQFNPGYLVDAIENGKVMIFDEINEVSKSILRRLNILLDKRYYGNKEEYFYLPEDSEKMRILIHDNFRIICTCKLRNIKQLSPSFINRFDIILLENQIKEINDYQLERLISNFFVSYDRIPERKKRRNFFGEKAQKEIQFEDGFDNNEENEEEDDVNNKEIIIKKKEIFIK